MTTARRRRSPTSPRVTVAPVTATVSVGGTVTLVATAFDLDERTHRRCAVHLDQHRSGRSRRSAPRASSPAFRRAMSVIRASAANGVDGSAAVHVNDGAPPVARLPHQRNPLRQRRHRCGRSHRDRRSRGRRRRRASRVVLYNGNGGVPYNTRDPDRHAAGELRHARRAGRDLSDQTASRTERPTASRWSTVRGQVLEFLSYEGTFTATSGPAAGLTSVDIGASQTNAAVGPVAAAEFRERVAAGRTRASAPAIRRRPTPVANTLQLQRPRAQRSGAAGGLRRPDLRDAARSVAT